MEHELDEINIEKIEKQINDLVAGLVISWLFFFFVIIGFVVWELIK